MGHTYIVQKHTKKSTGHRTQCAGHFLLSQLSVASHPSRQTKSVNAPILFLRISTAAGVKVFYWREGQKEVDFIIQKGKSLTALEVKSGRKRESLSGINTFSERFRPQRTVLLGEEGIPVERFLRSALSEWV